MYEMKLQCRELFWKVKIGVEWIALTSICNSVKFVTPVLFLNFFTGLLESFTASEYTPQLVISLLC